MGAERARLAQERDKAAGEARKIAQKLDNADFVARAGGSGGGKPRAPGRRCRPISRGWRQRCSGSSRTIDLRPDLRCRCGNRDCDRRHGNRRRAAGAVPDAEPWHRCEAGDRGGAAELSAELRRRRVALRQAWFDPMAGGVVPLHCGAADGVAWSAGGAVMHRLGC